jgi:hypothetical protein
VGGIADEADYNDNLTGYLIKRAKGKTASSHAATLKRDVGDAWIQRGRQPKKTEAQLKAATLKRDVGDAWIQRGRQPKKTEAQLKAEVNAVLSSRGGGGRSRR